MRERRKEVRRHLRGKNSKKTRKQIIESANAKLFGMDIDSDNMDMSRMGTTGELLRTTGTTGDDYNIQHTSMDVDNSDENAMDINAITFGKMCAARTPPVNSNKYAKRVGAKTSKKLEIAENHRTGQRQALWYGH